MDSSEKENSSGLNRSSTVSAVSRRVSVIVTWLIGIFTLTEEDRSQAGIQLRNYGHDEK